MRDNLSQLAFEFPAKPCFDRENFLVSASNEDAYAAVEAWPDWPAGALAVVGPEGAGKSHLAAVFAARAHAWIVAVADIAEERVVHLSSTAALVIEDADRVGLDEAACFHLVNRMRARGGALLLTARSRPDCWGLRTPDLLSRLRLAPVVEIAPPDEALVRAVLVKLFLDRQLVVDTGVVETIARRAERSIPALARLVEALDRAALVAKRRLTPAFVAAFLSRRPAEAEPGATP